jgi:la-related protein 1
MDPQLVRDVLELSSIVELRDDFVRMGAGEWVRFVLPDAPTSNVEVESGLGGELLSGQDRDRDHAEEDAEAEEEEEEEEIEIVMDREVLGQAWIT